MKKYIVEDLQEVSLSRQRRAQKKEPVTVEEFTALRSVVYKINWLGREASTRSLWNSFNHGLKTSESQGGGHPDGQWGDSVPEGYL